MGHAATRCQSARWYPAVHRSLTPRNVVLTTRHPSQGGSAACTMPVCSPRLAHTARQSTLAQPLRRAQAWVSKYVARVPVGYRPGTRQANRGVHSPPANHALPHMSCPPPPMQLPTAVPPLRTPHNFFSLPHFKVFPSKRPLLNASPERRACWRHAMTPPLALHSGPSLVRTPPTPADGEHALLQATRSAQRAEPSTPNPGDPDLRGWTQRLRHAVPKPRKLQNLPNAHMHGGPVPVPWGNTRSGWHPRSSMALLSCHGWLRLASLHGLA